jgi:glycerol-3-phosphate dehydrogenase
MKRDLALIAQQEHDLLVIGGGIYGACVAWDAALRGLSVVLVEKEDFGSATSANSLKTLHGGLRYLQDGNLARMRLMMCERRTWLRIAPRLVRPLPCILPTGGKLTRHKAAMKVALAINDLVSFDRNQGVSPGHHLPNGRILSRAECLQLVPGLAAEGISGAALWYDAQVLNSERLLLSILQSAIANGAAVANYAKVTALQQVGDRLGGAIVEDALTGCTHTLSARLVVNCAGAWSDSILATLTNRKPAHTFYLSTAINLITRQILPDVALGLPSRYAGRERILFVAPWQEYSLVGTWHKAYAGQTPGYRVDEATIQACLDEFNAAYPMAALSRDDVYHVQAGYLPMQPSTGGNQVKLVRESIVHDHTVTDGLEGIISVTGVKYTTALSTAAQVVDLVLRKLKRPHVPCQTSQIPVADTVLAHTEPSLEDEMVASHAALLPDAIQHLIQNYGTATRDVLGHLAEEPAWGRRIIPAKGVLGVEVIHAVRCEMARRLSDVIQRRTQLGAAGAPDRMAVNSCADLMAHELGWSPAHQAAEIETLYASYTICPTEKSGDF